MPVHHRPPPSESAQQRQPVGVFVKTRGDGEPLHRVAYTPSDAVALVFDGWQPQDTAPAVEAPPAPSPDGEPRPRTPKTR